MRPTKKAKLDLEGHFRSFAEEHEEQIRSFTAELKEKLEQKDEALQAAMSLACDPCNMPHRWTSMPPALQNDPTALTQAIVSNRFTYMKRSEVKKEVLQEALPNLLGNHRSVAIKACEDELLKWDEVHPTQDEWRESVYLSIQALRRGLVQDLEAEVPKLTHPMLANALKQGHLSWERIPMTLQDDLKFCRSVLDPEEIEVLGEDRRYHPRISLFPSQDQRTTLAMIIFGRHPELIQDHQVWEKLIKSSHPSPFVTIPRLFEEGYLPPDADLMEHACNKMNHLLTYVNQLSLDDMVRKLINKKPNALFYVSRPFIEQFPDFVASKLSEVHLEGLDLYQIDRLAGEVPPIMWINNVEFVDTWFRKGLPLLQTHPEAWKNDPEKFLLVAEHCPKYDWKKRSFYRAPEALTGCIPFVTNVMQFDPRLFEFASETLRYGNFELAVWALGNRQFVIRCRNSIARAEAMMQQHGQYPFHLGSPRPVLTSEKLIEYYDRASRELNMHNAFVKEFLCAVCIPDERRMHPKLRMLNQRSFLEAIGDFVGLARGDHLCNIRKALATLYALAAEIQNGGNN